MWCVSRTITGVSGVDTAPGRIGAVSSDHVRLLPRRAARQKSACLPGDGRPGTVSPSRVDSRPLLDLDAIEPRRGSGSVVALDRRQARARSACHVRLDEDPLVHCLRLQPRTVEAAEADPDFTRRIPPLDPAAEVIPRIRL